MKSLFDYTPPLHCLDAAPVRKSDPQTSHIAAASITAGERLNSEGRVYLALKRIGPTCDAVLITLPELNQHHAPSRIRTARKELVRQGLVEATGEVMTVLNRAGRPIAHLQWRIKP